VNLSEKPRRSEPKPSLGVIPRVCEFFVRSESASAVIMSEASLRAQSKDLARSSARPSLEQSNPAAHAPKRCCQSPAPPCVSSRASLRVEGPRILTPRPSRCSLGKIGVLRLAQRSLRMTKRERQRRNDASLQDYIAPWITRGGPREVLRLRQPPLRMTPGGANTLNSLPQLFWGRAGVGVQAVLNLCENRLFLAQQKSARESAAEKKYPALSCSTPTSFLPQDTGEEVRNSACESGITSR
jgi:hypothetical protein